MPQSNRLAQAELGVGEPLPLGLTRTSDPGAPYPAKDITYRYAEAGRTVSPRVDVTYTARFRVNGGAWQDIDETVTITGPEGSLRVSEARAVLSGNYG